MIGFTILLPIHVMAICKYSVDIDTNIVVGKVKPHPCTFDGELVQGAEFRDGDFIYRYKQEYYEDESDWKLKWRNIDEDGWGVIHKDVDSEVEGEIAPVMCTTINDKPIVSMSYTFYYMPMITKLDVSNIDTSNVVNMNNTFYGVGEYVGPDEIEGDPVKMSIVGLENFDTSKVKNMEGMFFGVGRSSGDTTITDLSTWDTSNVENMRSMFLLVAQGQFSIRDSVVRKQSFKINIDGINKWDVSNVKDLSYMFEEFGSTTKNLKLDFTDWNVSNVETFEGMFEDVGSLSETVNISGLDKWNVSSGTNFSYMFNCVGEYADSIIIDNVTNWDVSNAKDINSMFSALGKKSGKNIDIGKLSNWDTRNVEDMSFMFSYVGNQSPNLLDIGNLNIYADDISAMFQEASGIKATLNIYSTNPIYSNGNYGPIFKNAAINPNSLITVNYSRNTTNIDDIIASKSENSNVVKGILLD